MAETGVSGYEREGAREDQKKKERRIKVEGRKNEEGSRQARQEPTQTGTERAKQESAEAITGETESRLCCVYYDSRVRHSSDSSGKTLCTLY